MIMWKHNTWRIKCSSFPQIIPLRQSDVDMTVSNFRVLPDELRRNIPDLLLATMSAVFAQYKKAKVGKPASAAVTSASGAHERRQGEYREERQKCVAPVRALFYIRTWIFLVEIGVDRLGHGAGLG